MCFRSAKTSAIDLSIAFLIRIWEGSMGYKVF
jgi:hypothetical protein